MRRRGRRWPRLWIELCSSGLAATTLLEEVGFAGDLERAWLAAASMGAGGLSGGQLCGETVPHTAGRRLCFLRPFRPNLPKLPPSLAHHFGHPFASSAFAVHIERTRA